MRGGNNSRSGNIAEAKGLQDDLRQFGRNSVQVKSSETQGKYKGKRGKKGMHSKNSSRQSEPMTGSNRSGKN